MNRADVIVLQFGAFHLASGIDLLYRAGAMLAENKRTDTSVNAR
jgi:hypothetical protein